ncbi:MAG: twin-arginine translocation signal domain-containing protein, partial [Saprospiraceae bacterium]
MCEQHKKRLGSALEHGEAHALEHQMWSRRDFLTATGLLGAGSLLLGNMPIRAFQPSPLMAALANGNSDR